MANFAVLQPEDVYFGCLAFDDTSQSLHVGPSHRTKDKVFWMIGISRAMSAIADKGRAFAWSGFTVAALAMLSSCTFMSDPPPKTSGAFQATYNSPACQAASQASGLPAYPALVLACAVEGDVPDRTQQEALEKIILAALNRKSRRFESVNLGPGVSVETASLPDGTYYTTGIQSDRLDDGVIPGQGVALVLERPPGENGPNMPPEGVFEPVAITADVQRADGGLSIVLRAVEGAELRRDGWANAAGAAYARLLQQTRLRAEARDGFRSPQVDAFRREGIYFIEPYDPDRIPLLMIHGLRSSPEAWVALTNTVLSDPDLNRQFQVWHAFYPTGLPTFFSASRVRQQFRDALKNYDPQGLDLPSRRVAVVGHSMGGIIARALVTDDAGLLWRTSFRVPPEELMVPPDRLAAFRSVLTLRHEKQIGFVGFINTPHRGSRTAAGLIGTIGSALIRLPSGLTSFFRPDQPFVKQMTDAMRPHLVDRFADSVQSLSPDYPLIAALSGIPPSPKVRIVSVIGVRGGKSCLEADDCVATDGVVPYDSASLGFGEELVLNGGHDGHSDPAAIAFLREQLLNWAAER